MNLILPSSQSLVWSLTRPVMKGPVLIITRSTVLLLAPHSSYFFDAKVMQVMETNEYKEAPDLEKDPRWRSTFRFRGGGGSGPRLGVSSLEVWVPAAIALTSKLVQWQPSAL